MSKDMFIMETYRHKVTGELFAYGAEFRENQGFREHILHPHDEEKNLVYVSEEEFDQNYVKHKA